MSRHLVLWVWTCFCVVNAGWALNMAKFQGLRGVYPDWFAWVGVVVSMVNVVWFGALTLLAEIPEDEEGQGCLHGTVKVEDMECRLVDTQYRGALSCSGCGKVWTFYAYEGPGDEE
jgi:hypothetical protein